MRQCLLVVGTLFLGMSSPAMALQGQASGEWERVDASIPGTQLVITLASGAKHEGGFQSATTDALVLEVKGNGGATEPMTLRKADIVRVAAPKGAKLTAKVGGLLGFATVFGLGLATAGACGEGCEYDGGGALLLVGAGAGAAIGALLGHRSQQYASSSQILYPPAASEARRPSRFFADEPVVAIGASASTASFGTPSLGGSTTAPTFSVTWQAARHVSARVEYSHIDHVFTAEPGSVPAIVLENLVPAPANRAAGVPAGQESRRVGFILSELIGVSPRPFGRLRLEGLAGLGVVSHTDREYYPQSLQGSPTGKYYALDFESPETGFVAGLDAEVAVVRGLTVVPSVRHYWFDDDLSSTSVGIGAAWRFP